MHKAREDLEEVLSEIQAVMEERQERKKGKPRSKLVEAIAVLLLARPMRAAEIAQILGYPVRYISSYLSYWRTRGLFEYENGFWTLTPQGEEYARTILAREMDTRLHQYAALARQLLASHTINTHLQSRQTINDKDRATRTLQSSQLLSFIAGQTSERDKKRQNLQPVTCLNMLVEEADLTIDEKEVLKTLINHYAQWGTTYIYLDQLEEQLGADRAWLLRVLRSLQTKGLIYIYNDKRLGTRIGFSKRLRSLISSCS